MISPEQEIVSMVARAAGVSEATIRAETRLLHDLGLWGDDAEELLADLGRHFNIDWSGFEFDGYF